MGQMLTSSDKKKQLEALKLIDEQILHVKLDLVEGTGDKAGKIFARGEFGHAGKPTANGRFYPPSLWESNIQRLSSNLSERKVLGELDHPSDGRTALQRASHVITDLRLEGDRVIGEAEILDTSKGRDLKAILQAGVPVGISSRGYGSTKPDGKGKEVVQEDYKLVTFDFVAEPADNTAYPDVFFEGVEFPMEQVMDESTKTNEDEQNLDEGADENTPTLEESVAAQVSAMSPEEKELAKKFLAVSMGEENSETKVNTEALRKEFSAKILSEIGSMREELADEVRREMLADPEVAGAKTALEAVSRVLRPYLLPEDVNEVVEAKDAEIESLKRESVEKALQIETLEDLVGKLKDAAKEAGYKYHMERLISGESEADLIRSIVGDVTQYESPQEIEAKVEEAREVSESRRLEEEATTRVSSVRTHRLEEKNEQLAEGLEEALTVNKQLALRVYAAERLTNHPKAAKIRRMLENSGYGSKDQIDEIIDEFREPARDPDDLAEMRDRIRSKLYGGREHMTEDARPARGRRGGVDYNGTGVSLDDLKHLTGLNR
jgi:hypothetical protein